MAQAYPVPIPFAEFLGITLLEMQDGRAVLGCDAHAALRNSYGGAHGGLLMTLLDLAMVHAASGRREESDRALEHLTRTMADYAAYQIACVHAVRGERDQAFHWLDKAFQQHDAGLVMVRTHHQLSGLHADPRWSALLERLRLPA